MHSTPADKQPRRHCQRGARPHWFAMIGFSSARHADSDCARVASSPSYFLPRWSPPRQSGEIPPGKYPRRLAQDGAARGSFAHIYLLSVEWPVDSAGKITKATLPTWRVVHLVRHGRFFPPLAKSTPTENYPWRLCQDSASCRFFVRSGSCPGKWLRRRRRSVDSS